MVYTIYFLLTKKDIPVQIAKNKNRGVGLLFVKLSLIIGNRIITKDAAIQLNIVAIPITEGPTIYGMYIHTIGPKDNPKTPLKIIIPPKIKKIPIFLTREFYSSFYGVNDKPIAINNKEKVLTIVPNCSMSFLPNLKSK